MFPSLTQINHAIGCCAQPPVDGAESPLLPPRQVEAGSPPLPPRRVEAAPAPVSPRRVTAAPSLVPRHVDVGSPIPPPCGVGATVVPEAPRPYWPEVPNLKESLQCLAAPDAGQPTKELALLKPPTAVNGPARPKKQPQHIIVVLGVPTPEIGPLAQSLENRIHKAARLCAQDPSARIICSGGAVKTNVYEAQAICDGLQALGVERSRIIRELQAQTTEENAEYTFAILAQGAHLGPCRLTLVVEPYQAVRAMRAFVRTRDAYRFSQDYAIDLAPAAWLPVSQSAAYHFIVSAPGQGAVTAPSPEVSRWRFLRRRRPDAPRPQWRRPVPLGGVTPQTWFRHPGGRHPLDRVCPPDTRLSFERLLNEKLKLGLGH